MEHSLEGLSLESLILVSLRTSGCSVYCTAICRRSVVRAYQAVNLNDISLLESVTHSLEPSLEVSFAAILRHNISNPMGQCVEPIGHSSQPGMPVVTMVHTRHGHRGVPTLGGSGRGSGLIFPRGVTGQVNFYDDRNADRTGFLP